MLGRLTGLLAAVVLLGPAIAGPATASTTSFSWSTDADFSGDAAYTFQVDLGDDLNECEITWTFAGYTPDGGDDEQVDPVRWFVGMPTLGLGFADPRPEADRTTVGPVTIDHGSTFVPFAWAVRLQLTILDRGVHDFSAAGLALDRLSNVAFPGEEPGPQPAAELTVECQDPATVEPLAVGQSVAGFSESSLTGVNRERANETSAQAGVVRESFDTELGLMAYRTLDERSNATTTVVLDHPDGVETYHERGHTDERRRDLTQFEGSGGSWRLAMARAHDAEGTSEVEGVLAGLDPADSLDELG